MRKITPHHRYRGPPSPQGERFYQIFLKKIAKTLDKLLTHWYNTIDWTTAVSVDRRKVSNRKELIL